MWLAPVIEIQGGGCYPRRSELFWAWLRKKLRALDLKDAIADRPVLSKMAYTQRAHRVLKTQKAQTTAKNIALRLKKACRLVVKGGGAAIKG